MYDQTSRLVNDNQIVIFIDNIDGSVFRREAFRGCDRQFDFDAITGANSVGRFCLTAIHQDRRVFDQILQPRATPPVHARGEKRIKTLACFFGCYLKSTVRILIEFRVHAVWKQSLEYRLQAESTRGPPKGGTPKPFPKRLKAALQTLLFARRND